MRNETSNTAIQRGKFLFPVGVTEFGWVSAGTGFGCVSFRSESDMGAIIPQESYQLDNATFRGTGNKTHRPWDGIPIDINFYQKARKT